LYMEVGPVSACNHQCVHCYVDYLGHESVMMADDTLINLMKDMGSYGVKSACFAGRGEPMLHKKIVEAIEAGHDSGLDLALATNGIPLNSEKIDRILKHLQWIRFSVLGGSMESYKLLQGAREADWAKMQENISLCVKNKRDNNLDTTIGVVFFLFKENGHEVVEVTNMFREIGVDYLVIKPVGDYEKNNYVADKNLKDKYESSLKEAEAMSNDSFNCTIRWDMFEQWEDKQYSECLSLPFMAVVDADGDVYACGGYWQDKRYNYGNVNEKPFPELWDSDERKKVTEHMRTNVDLNECYNCCRNHTLNNFLWGLRQVPSHVNYI